MKLAIPTNNKGKLVEIKSLLESFDIEVLSAEEVGVSTFPPESGTTYEANALIKARHLTEQTGLAALADDSGLEVDALGGAPGVYSARFGNKATDKERIDYLLSELKNYPNESRKAHFVCCLVLNLLTGEYKSFQGTTSGNILEAPKGKGGFGYDPIFLSDDLGKSFAEASRDEKQRVSHRGRALKVFLKWLKTHNLT